MSQRRKKPLNLIANRTFTREFVQLDGNRFVGCRFIECVIHYSGGLADVSACTFGPRTSWAFNQQAANTIQLLERLGFQVDKPVQQPVPLEKVG